MPRQKKAVAEKSPVAATRRGRPKGSKNKKPAPLRAAMSSNVGRRRTGPGRPRKQNLASRIDAMVRELEGLRADVRELEDLAGVVGKLRRTVG